VVGDKNSSERKLAKDRHLTFYLYCMSEVAQTLMIGLTFQIFTSLSLESPLMLFVGDMLTNYIVLQILHCDLYSMHSEFCTPQVR